MICNSINTYIIYIYTCFMFCVCFNHSQQCVLHFLAFVCLRTVRIIGRVNSWVVGHVKCTRCQMATPHKTFPCCWRMLRDAEDVTVMSSLQLFTHLLEANWVNSTPVPKQVESRPNQTPKGIKALHRVYFVFCILATRHLAGQLRKTPILSGLNVEGKRSTQDLHIRKREYQVTHLRNHNRSNGFTSTV